MNRLLALSLCAAGLLAAGCGDSDSGSNPPASQTTTTPAPTTAAETPTAAETTAESSGGGGKLTKPGTELSVGDVAHVTMKPFSGNARYPLDVTVEKIEKGTIDDFKNIELDAKQKQSTPYYITVKVANTGDKAFKTKTDDPDVRFDAIDDRGQEQGSITFFGTFERCDDTQAPNPFKPGQSYESCLAYLMPGGGSIDAAQWTGSDEYISDPVVWK